MDYICRCSSAYKHDLCPDCLSFYQRVGRTIAHRRKARKLSQEMLALQLGIERTSVTNIEAGRQHSALHLYLRIAQILGCALSDLFPLSPSIGSTKPRFRIPPTITRRFEEREREGTPCDTSLE